MEFPRKRRTVHRSEIEDALARYSSAAELPRRMVMGYSTAREGICGIAVSNRDRGGPPPTYDDAGWWTGWLHGQAWDIGSDNVPRTETQGAGKMTTFAKWLLDQVGQPTATGWLATEWNEALHRPRVSTPAGIEKHLAEVHSGDETYIGQLASAVRIATDAYHHRDDPQSYDPAAGLAEQGLELAPGAHDVVLGDADQLAAVPETDNTQDWAASANQFDQDAADLDTQTILMSLLVQQDRMMGLIRSMAAVMGLNVDDDSITAMTELWNASPGADQLIRDAAGESLSAQLAEPTPPQAFATWWNTADHSEPPAPPGSAG